MLSTKLAMLWLVGTFLTSTVLLTSCAAKHLPMPEPVYGVDIIKLATNEAAPFNGVEMSPFYLNSYLQWKCTDEGKC